MTQTRTHQPHRYAARPHRGPQRATVRGHDAVVVIAAEELERLLPIGDVVPFVTFMDGLSVDGLDLTRAPDTGRDAGL